MSEIAGLSARQGSLLPLVICLLLLLLCGPVHSSTYFLGPVDNTPLSHAWNDASIHPPAQAVNIDASVLVKRPRGPTPKNHIFMNMALMAIWVIHQRRS